MVIRDLTCSAANSLGRSRLDRRWRGTNTPSVRRRTRIVPPSPALLRVARSCQQHHVEDAGSDRLADLDAEALLRTSLVEPGARRGGVEVQLPGEPLGVSL